MRDVARRQQKDHERYLRQREVRLERQRAYYKEHCEEIRYKKRNGLIR